MLKLENVGKIYNTQGNVAVGIRGVNLELHLGEFVAITGESGSGKTTLLNILSGIDTYEEGEMYINGEESSFYEPEDLEEYRNNYVGFIFQNYNVIDSLNVLQNVETSLIFAGKNKEERRKKALELIDRVGLTKHIHTKASKLSGGEKQRLVIARALSKDAKIIACDEPTGNLDSKTSEEIIELLHEVSKDKLVLIVTHDFNEVEKYATRYIRIYDGKVEEDRIITKTAAPDNEEEIVEIPKTKFKDIFGIAKNDMLGSPKRLIFHLIVYMILALTVLIEIGGYRFIIDGLSEEFDYDYTFETKDESRIILYKDDKSSFTASEIESLKNNANINDIYLNDILLDSTYYFDFASDNGYYNPGLILRKISELNEDELAYGKIGTNNNDIVITYSSQNLHKGDSFKDIIDNNTTVNCYLNEYLSFNITGIIDSKNKRPDEVRYAYISDDIYNKVLVNSYVQGRSIKYYVNDENYYFYSISNLDELNENEIYFTELSKFEDDELVNISICDLYHLVDSPIYSGTFVNKNLSIYGSSLYVSNQVFENICNKLISENSQISIFINNPNNIEKVAKSLNNSGYHSVIPSKSYTESDPIVAILMIVLIFSFGSYLAEAFFLVYVILLHSMKSKRDDIAILRTIGAKKNDIRNMLSIQFIILGIVGFIISLTIFFVIKSASHGVFLKILQSMNVLDFIIEFVALILLSYLLSLFYSVTVFRKTITNSLNER